MVWCEGLTFLACIRTERFEKGLGTAGMGWNGMEWIRRLAGEEYEKVDAGIMIDD